MRYKDQLFKRGDTIKSKRGANQETDSTTENKLKVIKMEVGGGMG